MNTATLSDGRVVSVDALLRLTHCRECRTVPVSSLWVPHDPRSAASGYCRLRYVNADYRLPLLVTPDGQVLDGRHRLLKLVDLGGRVASVIVVTSDELTRCVCRRN